MTPHRQVVQIRALGPLRVEVDGEQVPLPAGRATVAMATLALHAGEVTPRERLLEAAWGERAPKTGTAQVQAHISALRRRLPAGAIRTHGGGYLLAPEWCGLDLVRFNDHVDRARAGGADALTEYRSALALWQGTPFDGIRSTYLQLHALRLRLAYLSVVEETAAMELDLGDYRAAAERLYPIVAEDPLRESASALLMRVLYQWGQRADALAVYRRVREALTVELGVEPGTQLRAAHAQILGGGPEVAPQPGGEGTADRSVASACQLPPGAGDFTGREREVAQVSRNLLAGADRRGTAVVIQRICGGGGIGKTALALHVAHQLSGSFVDGQLYADLGAGHPPAADPSDVLAGWLRSLGTSPDRVPPDVEDRAALLRTLVAGRRMLVVLDDAADAAQVRPLLPGTGGCAALVTSRHRLPQLSGHYLELDLLPEASAHDLLARIAGRARLAADPAASRAVLRACAGLPLAVHIAGRRLAADPMGTVAQLARRLRRSDRVLDELRADGLAVSSAFRASFQALLGAREPGGPRAAQAFRRFGRTGGHDFGVPAAAALTGLSIEDTEDALELLVDAHLVRSPRAGRYAVHGLARTFAAQLGKPDRL